MLLENNSQKIGLVGNLNLDTSMVNGPSSSRDVYGLAWKSDADGRDDRPVDRVVDGQAVDEENPEGAAQLYKLA
jgi:hypothetical protein